MKSLLTEDQQKMFETISNRWHHGKQDERSHDQACFDIGVLCGIISDVEHRTKTICTCGGCEAVEQ